MSSLSAADFFYQGTHLISEGKAVAAMEAFRQVLALAPDLPEAHVNLGWLMESEGRDEEAEQHYRRALEIDPLQLQTRLNLGTLMLAQKRFADAEHHCRYAAALAPDSPAALSNLGVLLAFTQREKESEQCYRAALAIDPDYRKAHFNLAYLLLRQGRYDEGWHRLEARDSNLRFDKAFQFPRWHGEALAGKSILIAYEAGHGDMIQFCRYADLVMQRGAARITILCHPGLKKLFGCLRSVDEVIDFSESFPIAGWDYWTMALSLPFLFETRLDTIPDQLPYLFPQRKQVRQWAGALADNTHALKVGLVWKGNPLHDNDADRSMSSLEVLAPLAEVSGVRYFSLQKGSGEQEAGSAAASFTVRNLAPDINDFSDTAAIVANLDLVITVDTSVAHLTGALGKPCWVLLPHYMTDWRWLAERNDTPWYPHVMRLFRQRIAGDWPSLIAEVKTALHALLAERNNGTRL
jgi:Flp pilus assembly protein TadD